MSEANVTSRWSQRLGFTAIVLILATIGLGVAYYVGSTVHARRAIAADEMRTAASTVAEVGRAIAQSRRFEDGILARGTEAGGVAHEAALDDATGELDTLIASTSDPEVRSRAIELRGAIVAYGHQFTEFLQALDTVGRDDDSGLRGLFHQSGDAAEKRLAQLGAAGLANLLRTIRQQDQASLVEHGATYDSALAERKAAFEQALAASSLPPAAQNEIMDSMAVVFRNAVMLMEANLALNASSDQLNALSADIDTALGALTASVEARETSLGSDVEPSLVNPPKDVLACIAIGLTLMALAVWMFGRRILPSGAPAIETAVEAGRAEDGASPMTPPDIRAATASAIAEGNALATQAAWVAPQGAVHRPQTLEDLMTAPAPAFEPQIQPALAYRYEDIEEDIDEDVLELIEVAGPIPFETIAAPSQGDAATADIHQLTERARVAAHEITARMDAVQHAAKDVVKAIESFNDIVRQMDPPDHAADHRAETNNVAA
ncbi:MAG: hypothetical protein U1F33_02370 [Alphaproteobacteria bacterium]